MNTLWTGDFGDSYTKRCGPDTPDWEWQVAAREQLFLTIQRQTGVSFFGLESIVEYGCNAGLNLSALRNFWPSVPTIGVEPNEFARSVAASNGHNVIDGLLKYDATKRTPAVGDLAFTAGVLIHVPPHELDEAMSVVVDSAKRYVLAIEYFAPESRMVRYRGLDQAMWLDDFGSRYLRFQNLELRGYGFSWKPVTNMDNTTWWLFEKVSR